MRNTWWMSDNDNDFDEDFDNYLEDKKHLVSVLLGQLSFTATAAAARLL